MRAITTMLVVLVLGCDDGLWLEADPVADGVESVACADLDGDGWCAPDDCDDDNARVHPGAVERCLHSYDDDDCDGVRACYGEAICNPVCP